MSGGADNLLILTGTMGAGKSSVLAEMSDLLTLRGVQHAAIDLDELERGEFKRGSGAQRLLYRNLRSVWENYAAQGLTRLLLATALEDRTDLECCLQAVHASRATICRLVADLQTMEQRVRAREQGTMQADLVARVRELNTLLDQAKLEDFCVANDNRSVVDVACEVLARAGWSEPT